MNQVQLVNKCLEALGDKKITPSEFRKAFEQIASDDQKDDMILALAYNLALIIRSKVEAKDETP